MDIEEIRKTPGVKLMGVGVLFMLLGSLVFSGFLLYVLFTLWRAFH